MSDAAAGASGEGVEEAVAGGRWAAHCSIHRPGGGRGVRERAAERRLDGGAALRGVQRPGEGDEVAPVAVGLEERCRGVEVAAREGGGEGFEPARGRSDHTGNSRSWLWSQGLES